MSEVTMADLEHGARLQVRVTGDEKGRLVEPTVSLSDVVLPAAEMARLERFVRAAKVRSTALVDWGLGRALGSSTGLAALFSGPSGTGKSMAVEAVAHALGRPLLRCDLPLVVSKYVGETSKNLDALFRLAREQRAVLVFDEADALFARRTDVKSAQERFANAEVGALLTQLERHDGVVVLTTNMLPNLDPAFERRLHVRIAFPLPGASERTRLWQRFLGCDAPWAKDVDPLRLARAHDLSGGAIRAAVLNAALEAASQPAGKRIITHDALDRAAREQLDVPAMSSVAGGCA
jgi:SpoVK/Ycf46/Vps4 family AAA+-type ATPase